MKEIWKFELAPEQTIFMPKGAKILCVQTQFNRPVLWAEVNTKNSVEARNFRAYATGQTLPDNHGDYIGTFQIEGDSLVFHIYEVKS